MGDTQPGSRPRNMFPCSHQVLKVKRTDAGVSNTDGMWGLLGEGLG